MKNSRCQLSSFVRPGDAGSRERAASAVAGIMSRPTLRPALTVFCLLSLGWVGSARAGDLPVKEYDMTATIYKGERLRGSKKIVAKNLNVLRYDYAWNSETTFTAGPDLWKALTPEPIQPAVPAEQETPKTQAVATRANAAPPPPWTPLPCTDPTVKTLKKVEAAYCKAYEGYKNATRLARSIVERISKISGLYGQAVAQRTELQKKLREVNGAIAAVAGAGNDLQALLDASTGKPKSFVIGEIGRRLYDSVGTEKSCSSPSLDCIFLRGIKATWPLDDINELRNAAEGLRAELDKQKADFQVFNNETLLELMSLRGQLQASQAALQKAFALERNPIPANVRELVDHMSLAAQELDPDLNKTKLTIAVANLEVASKETDKTLTVLPSLSDSSDKYIAFRDAQSGLEAWRVQMAALVKAANDKAVPDPFSSSAEGVCSFQFAQTKKIALTLSRTDRKPGVKDAKPEQVLEATVECTSPFSVTAGVAFSSIQEREFSIVPSAAGDDPPTVVNKFEVTSKSSFHPLPIAMVHARLWEPNEKFAVHAGFGMAGNFRSAKSGGSDVEFLIGPSISLFRTMFISPGLHIGHHVSLGGGFREGDIVPAEGVPEPPLQKAYNRGFGLAITFTKP
jgi:hypothetical protein